MGPVQNVGVPEGSGLRMVGHHQRPAGVPQFEAASPFAAVWTHRLWLVQNPKKGELASATMRSSLLVGETRGAPGICSLQRHLLEPKGKEEELVGRGG